MKVKEDGRKKDRRPEFEKAESPIEVSEEFGERTRV
jgi:hypothetical protein